MHIVYICKVVDEANTALANQVRWIRALSQEPRVTSVHVLTHRRGAANLPDNVAVDVIRGTNWPSRAADLYRLFVARLHRADFFFISQGGPYPALLYPLKIVFGRPIYHWKAHPHISWRMQIYARLFDDLVFTSTPNSFPLAHRKVRIVGQGIDTHLFRPLGVEPDRDLVAVGRITPIKRLERVLLALAAARERFMTDYRLDVVGPCYRSHRHVLDELVAMSGTLGLDRAVRFLGGIHQEQLPQLLARYRACINLSDGAFDKTSGEAMANRLPVITSNPATAQILPPDLRDMLVVSSDDVAAQAASIHRVLSWEPAVRVQIGDRLRRIIVEDQGLTSFFTKILDEIEANLAGRLRPLSGGRRAAA